MMIFEFIIGLLVLACLLYYLTCLGEIFGLIKWTDENTVIEFPKWLIPFYYLVKKSK